MTPEQFLKDIWIALVVGGGSLSIIVSLIFFNSGLYFFGGLFIIISAYFWRGYMRRDVILE